MSGESAVILARVSSKSQEDEGYSLDSQLKLLRGYCEKQGLKIVEEFKIAETASKEQSRKTFHKMLDYIAKHKVYHLTVEKTDRLTRNFRDAVAIDDWLDKDDSRRLHCVKENLLVHKNAKSDVKFMWNIHVSVSKKYTDNLREEAMKGWAEKLAQGWLPAVPPPGYKTITEKGKRIHVPDLDTKAIIQRMFKLYLDPSHSIATIAQEMNLAGIRTRNGKPYYKSKVQDMLTNPFYVGINHFNGKDYPGAQEPIIGKDLFERVQAKMHKKRPSIYKKHNPVFKNLIHCTHCGGVVTWQRQDGYYYGSCQRNSEACKGRKFLRQDKLEAVIATMLKDLISPSQKVIGWVADAMREQRQAKIETHDRLIASIQMQIGRIDRMDGSLYDDKLAGDITREKYQEKHDDFIKQKTELEQRLSKLGSSFGSILEYRLALLELSQKAGDIYARKTPEQKRLIITKLFEDLQFDADSVSVTYTKFARAIAQSALETRQLIGGAK